MNTDAWIAALASQVAPVDPRAPRRRLALAAAAGLALAVPLVLWLLGMNPELAGDLQRPSAWLKWGFVITVVVASGAWLARAARPASRTTPLLLALAAVFAALWGVAAMQLASAAPPQRVELLMGSSWRTCPVSIPLLSLPALALLLAAVRTLAPTRPVVAGAAAGLLAGALATLGYLLHCPELAAPFIATWYVLGMAAPAALGALLGARVLRW